MKGLLIPLLAALALPTAEILMASELIENYLLDKRFMRELEDMDEYDAA